MKWQWLPKPGSPHDAWIHKINASIILHTRISYLILPCNRLTKNLQSLTESGNKIIETLTMFNPKHSS